MQPKISVVIPVGPYAANQRWLPEALESIARQTRLPDEVYIICDMAGLPAGMDNRNPYPIRTWCSPWLLGVANAFNFGVALADYECVFMLGSDDWLEPECLEACMLTYEKLPEADKGSSYIFVGVKYDDDRENKTQFMPCNAAMVTKSLWQKTGGFPIEASTGAPDAAFCSIFWNRPEIVKFIGVWETRTLYNYRVHDETDTAGRQPWQGVILQTRDLLTRTWLPPLWGRETL